MDDLEDHSSVDHQFCCDRNWQGVNKEDYLCESLNQATCAFENFSKLVNQIVKYELEDLAEELVKRFADFNCCCEGRILKNNQEDERVHASSAVLWMHLNLECYYANQNM